VAEARERARALESRAADLERLAASAPIAPAFGRALRSDVVSVIAEVKRRSPSKGWIQPGLDAGKQAEAYERAGARAISVLTEPQHFAGSNEDLLQVRAAVAVPALKKDFHVEPIQLIEAKALGASAALLIVRALGPSGLSRMINAARELALEVLVEIRDERELDLALANDAPIIGINNRNLETLEIDPATSERLLKRIPARVIVVGESGVAGRADVERMAAAGADAVLVGSSVSSASDPADAVRRLTGVQRYDRVD
jgi:indole-3-glycerol phosphate synthase